MINSSLSFPRSHGIFYKFTQFKSYEYENYCY